MKCVDDNDLQRAIANNSMILSISVCKVNYFLLHCITPGITQNFCCNFPTACVLCFNLHFTIFCHTCSHSLVNIQPVKMEGKFVHWKLLSRFFNHYKFKFLEHKAEMNAEFEELKIRWENFISKFETLAPKAFARKTNVFHNMITSTRTKESFVEMARGTRPFISKEIWELLEKFMEFMRNLPDPEGANYRAVYDKMSLADLVKRLLTKRPIVFFKQQDDNVLRSNPLTLRSGKSKWDNITRTLEKKQNDWPYLREYISYDEMLLSVFVNMATPTCFVSDGSVKNPDMKSTKPFIPDGILCGVIGARLRKKGFMEHRFVFPRDRKNAGFFDVHHTDAFWIKNLYPDAFPEGKVPTDDEVRSKPEIYKNIYVDGINVVYFKKRLALSVVLFIEEAANRGMEKKETVVASVPPIGAGVWRGSVPAETIVNLIVTGVLDHLDQNFDVGKLSFLGALYLPVADSTVYSSYRPQNQILSINVGSSDIRVTFKGRKDKFLTIFNQFRYVAQLLPSNFSSSLTVAGYAWDGNSYPGNEYWKDSISSFDSQAILCSNLGQLQNPEVNVQLSDPERIKIY